MNRSIFTTVLIMGAIVFSLFLPSSSVNAQVPAWLVDINTEIDLMEENVADCRKGIEDIQAEIDALIKNTPPPITGTPTEDKIRKLQKERALYRCWADMTDKKIRRLKVIRDVLKKRYGQSAGNGHLQGEINKAQRKVDKVEQDAKNNQRAGQRLENTIKGALGEHK